MMEFVNGKDDNPYMKWKVKNAWNHQLDILLFQLLTIINNRLTIIN